MNAQYAPQPEHPYPATFDSKEVAPDNDSHPQKTEPIFPYPATFKAEEYQDRGGEDDSVPPSWAYA